MCMKIKSKHNKNCKIKSNYLKYNLNKYVLVADLKPVRLGNSCKSGVSEFQRVTSDDGRDFQPTVAKREV